MNTEDRPATRYDPRDTDPLTVPEPLTDKEWDAFYRAIRPDEPPSISRSLLVWVIAAIVVAFVVAAIMVAASREGGDSNARTVLRLPGMPRTSATEREGHRGLPGGDAVRLGVSVLSEGARVPLPDTAATSVSGTATWYCGGGSACTRGVPPRTFAAAAGPALRVGDWRGRIVKVCAVGTSRCVRVALRDWCACPRRVIDLYRLPFSKLASPSRGLVRVSVTWGDGTLPLPPTSTKGGSHD